MKIVYVTALWCSACLVMHKRIQRIKSRHPDWIWENHDLDLDETFVKTLNIGKVLPVFIVYQNDIEVKRVIGEMDEATLERALYVA